MRQTIDRPMQGARAAILTAKDFEAIGEAMLVGILEASAAGLDVTGQPLATLDPEYAGEVGHSRSTLRRTGALQASMRVVVSLPRQVVEVIPGVAYARFVHQGTSRMAARPFLGISKTTSDQIRRRVSKTLKRRLAKPVGGLAAVASGETASEGDA